MYVYSTSNGMIKFFQSHLGLRLLLLSLNLCSLPEPTREPEAIVAEPPPPEQQEKEEEKPPAEGDLYSLSIMIVFLNV